MTPDQKREYNKLRKKMSREKETPKKSWWRRKKDREYHQRKRSEKKQPRSLQNQHPLCSPVKKGEYNLVSKIRKTLLRKTPSKFARLLKNLSQTKCAQKAAALQREGLISSVQKHNEPFKKLNSQLAALRKKFAKPQRKKRSDALSEEARKSVSEFYKREDISRALPHKRYATKAGPGFVLQHTLRQAHNLFKTEHPTLKIGYVKFCALRPKNVRKISAQFLDTCQCYVCLNVRLKILAMNQQVTKKKLDATIKVADEQQLYKMLLCSKGDARFHKISCINGSCDTCSDHKKTLHLHYKPLLATNVTMSWSHWKKGAAGREPVVRTGSVSDLMNELVTDVDEPTRATTFVQHLFTANWQHWQYRDLKSKLKPGEALLVMDYAENKKSAFQDEIKSAHYNKQTFSLHPVVAFYRTDGVLVRHAINFVSDDTTHDFHAVHHFTSAALTFLKDRGIVQPGGAVYIFSDNCAAQYKCKGSFADLTQYSQPVQRIYFGAEHGKGEADGETGVISKAVESAVLCRKVTIRNAHDFFTWCEENLTKDATDSKRDFKFVSSEDIQRHRPESEVQTVRGSRKFHQVMPSGVTAVRARALACFCCHCAGNNYTACLQEEYVGPWQTYQLQFTSEMPSPPSPQPTTPPPPLVPRDTFFRSLQGELERAKRHGFGAFVACAQNGMRKAKDYPLPFPATQPEFARADQVDERAEEQRPAGAAPSSHFAKTTPGDGNCLVRALSSAVFGSEDFQQELRVRLTCELALRKFEYLSPEYISRGSEADGLHSLAMYVASGDFHFLPLEVAFDGEVMAAVGNSRDLGMWHILAAANVLQCRIWSIYPTMDPTMHRQCLPDGPPRADVFIQWTCFYEDDVKPNHFVPVVKDCANNVTEVRVGDFVLADFFSNDGQKKTYHGVVVERPEWMNNIENDVCVKCLRAKENGRYYVFPPVDDISSVPMQHLRKSTQPTMNNRGHFFF